MKKNASWPTLACSTAALVLAACGGGGGSAPTDPTTTADTQSAQSDTNVAAPGTPNYARASAAARNAASTDPLCAASVMGDYYWEIGDATASPPIVSHSEGNGTVAATTHFNIASASKFIFGAYMLQKKGIDQVRADPSLFSGMRFMSGYTGFSEDACAGTTTVGACYQAGGATSVDPNTVGKFDYDGGHDQKLASIDLGMANYTARQIDQEYQTTLGLSVNFNMAALDPTMAGGMMGSANDYAQFLRKIMNKELVIASHLGEDSVCTLDRACPGQVAYSPIAALGEPWRYSYNHWVESQNGNGTIDAYSSPGKWGFYPWVTPDLKYYGIVSRHDTSPAAYGVSVKCGRQIRKAFLGAL